MALDHANLTTGQERRKQKWRPNTCLNADGVKVINMNRRQAVALLARQWPKKKKAFLMEALVIQENYEPMIGLVGWDNDEECAAAMSTLEIEDKLFGPDNSALEMIMSAELESRNLKAEAAQERTRMLTSASRAQYLWARQNRSHYNKVEAERDAAAQRRLEGQTKWSNKEWGTVDGAPLEYAAPEDLQRLDPGASVDGSGDAAARIAELDLSAALLSGDAATELSLSVDGPGGTTIRDLAGVKYLVPQDIAQAMRHRSTAAPQADQEITAEYLQRLDRDWKAATIDTFKLGRIATLPQKAEGEPGYYVHMQVDGQWRTYAVFGYLADHGYRYALPPQIPVDQTQEPNKGKGRYAVLTWSNSTWLNRCPQCGRELPASYFPITPQRRCRPICKGCKSVNSTAQRLMDVPTQYWNLQELRFMSRLADLYRTQWRSNLSPRGPYAEQVLGTANVKERQHLTSYNAWAKHDKARTKDGYRPNGCKASSWEKMDRYCALMDDMLRDEKEQRRADKIYRDFSDTTLKIEGAIEEAMEEALRDKENKA